MLIVFYMKFDLISFSLKNIYFHFFKPCFCCIKMRTGKKSGLKNFFDLFWTDSLQHFFLRLHLVNVHSFLQLNQVSEDPLKRPVVYVKGPDAVKLMNIVNKQKVARARIQHRPPRVSLSKSSYMH